MTMTMPTSEVLARLDEIEKRQRLEIAVIGTNRARKDALSLCAAVRELEARVRERDEALRVARKALNTISNEPIGPMDASDREVLQACESVALDALAHPLIGGAK